MSKSNAAAVAIAVSVAFSTPVMAAQQDDRPSAWSMFGIIARNLGCEAVIALIERTTDMGEIARDVAVRWGYCPDPADAEEPVVEASPPDGGLQPGLTVQLLEVSGPAGSRDLAPANPQTRYGQGEGIVAFLTFNAPGYLEVWSRDDDGDEFLEAFMLSMGGGTTMLLPGQESSFYEFYTTGPDTEYLSLRYYPCRHNNAEGLRRTRENNFGVTLENYGVPGTQLNSSLPQCPFSNAEFNPASGMAGRFDRALPVTPIWSDEARGYVAVLDRVVNTGRPAMIVDIPLRRGS